MSSSLHAANIRGAGAIAGLMKRDAPIATGRVKSMTTAKRRERNAQHETVTYMAETARESTTEACAAADRVLESGMRLRAAEKVKSK